MARETCETRRVVQKGQGGYIRKAVTFKLRKDLEQAEKQARARARQFPDDVDKGAGKQLFSWYVRWLIQRDAEAIERERE